jgi:hypothetical protein
VSVFEFVVDVSRVSRQNSNADNFFESFSNEKFLLRT